MALASEETPNELPEGVTATEGKEEDIRPDANAKDEFKGLGAAFKDSLQGLNAGQLKEKLADLQLSHLSNEAALRADQDVKQKRESLNTATLIYRKERAELKLKMKCVTRHLSDGGDPGASQVTTNEEAAKSLSSM